jgi:hypothetical protein
LTAEETVRQGHKNFPGKKIMNYEKRPWMRQKGQKNSHFRDVLGEIIQRDLA